MWFPKIITTIIITTINHDEDNKIQEALHVNVRRNMHNLIGAS